MRRHSYTRDYNVVVAVEPSIVVPKIYLTCNCHSNIFGMLSGKQFQSKTIDNSDWSTYTATGYIQLVATADQSTKNKL